MNTIVDFQQLTLDEKVEYVNHYGHFLLCNIEQNSILSLYALGSFYVEFCYDLAKNDIAFLEAFTDTDFLSPYLDKISLKQLTRY